MSPNLLYSYHTLLKEYDKVLTLTDKLLSALQSGETDEALMTSLVNKRLKSVKLIQKMTQSLCAFNPLSSQKPDLQIIERLKSIHSKLEEKANLLKNKEKELEKLAEDLD